MEKEEVYKIIKSRIKIMDYARRLGFTVIRKGKYYSLKEHDSVIIDPVKNCFWRNSQPGYGKAVGRGGSIIDFLLEFTDKPLHEILKELSTEAIKEELDELPVFTSNRSSADKISKTERLQLPDPDSNMRNVFAYLVKTRHIAQRIVQELVDRKQLYQDTHKNCVFVGYDIVDGVTPVFACRRGTNTYKAFYGDVENSDYSQCFYIPQKAKKLYVTESVIDALSVMTLKEDWRQYDYLALAGVGKTDAIYIYLDNLKLEEVWIGTDQDQSGRDAAALLQEKINQRRPDIKIVMDLPGEAEKDWNQILQERTQI